MHETSPAMTSKEVVRRALNRQRPPRLPVRFPGLHCDDIAWLPLTPPVTPFPANGNVDEWGCVWQATAIPNMGQVTGHPLRDAHQIDAFAAPYMDIDERFAACHDALGTFEQHGKYVMTDIFMVLFERMHALYGFEATLGDLLGDRPAMEALADRILAAQIEFVQGVYRRFGTRVHGIGMTDDWGTQQAAFISMDLWRDFFLPRYQKLFTVMHACGYDVWVHSCGKVNEIIEGFLEAGVDAMNLLQPHTLGIEEIGHRYRGRLLLESAADIQVTLPTGDRARIEEDVDALMQHWATPEGGFMACDYGDARAIGAREPRATLWMYQRFSWHSERLYGSPLPEPVMPEIDLQPMMNEVTL